MYINAMHIFQTDGDSSQYRSDLLSFFELQIVIYELMYSALKLRFASSRVYKINVRVHARLIVYVMYRYNLAYILSGNAGIYKTPDKSRSQNKAAEIINFIELKGF